MELSELHSCEKSEGKIVAITCDALGVTRCGYCNVVVDYKGWIEKYGKEEIKHWIDRLKEEGKE